MPLTTEQKQKIIATLEPHVNRLIQNSHSYILPQCIGKLDKSFSQAVIYLTPEYVAQVVKDEKTPEVTRNLWNQFKPYVERHIAKIPEQLSKDLQADPNYDPICLAAMQEFMELLSAFLVKPEVMRSMIYLRECYLEMRPLSPEYYKSYTTFHARTGATLFDFEQQPALGEIQSVVHSYISEQSEKYEQSFLVRGAVINAKSAALKKEAEAAQKESELAATSEGLSASSSSSLASSSQSQSHSVLQLFSAQLFNNEVKQAKKEDKSTAVTLAQPGCKS